MEMIRNATKMIGIIGIIGMLFAVSIRRAQANVIIGNTATVIDLNLIYDGDIVLLKSAFGGYLKDDGDGTLSTHPTFNDEGQLWKAEINQNGYGTMFLNQKTGKYLKTSDSSIFTGSISGPGDAASFKQKGYAQSTPLDFDYEFAYSFLANYNYGICITTQEIADTTITVSPCTSLNSAWRYEVLYRYVAPIDWNKVFKCLNHNYVANTKSNCGLF